jgi:3-hydroxyisobutyrate dehydrogenase-like beta-hydroxyacid dehydrogenase
MTISTVAVLSPGDMGHSVGAVLHDHGLRVVTCLANRSERTRELATEAGFEDLPSLDDVVRESDLVISIVVPAKALDLAEEVAAALERTGASILFADCNAVAPRTVNAAAAAIQAAGSRFTDAGIIGPPPRRPGTRFYTSGPGAEEFAQLNEFGLTINMLPGEIGQASGLKACYAALTKGLQALGIELLVAAHAMGLDDVLAAEQAESMSTIRTYLERSTPVMPSKAHRWIGEMEEIGLCFEDLGMTPRLLQGVADMYRFIAETPIGKETPENRDESRDLTGIIAALGDALTTTAEQRA